MAEPTTPNTGLIVPATGDLIGQWGTAALNVNFTAIDGYVGGVQTLSMAGGTTIALTTASATLSPVPGPFQSANALLVLTGMLTATSTIQFIQPGIYRVANKCSGNSSFPIVLAPSTGGGTQIGLPPGKAISMFFDGSNCDYLDPADVGSYLDVACSTTPLWMQACTKAPYLYCDGSVHTSANFPALAEFLGSTWGGNGATTFGIPDSRNRVNVPLDIGGTTGRVTSGGSGVNGAALAASGGNQASQAHSHGVTDPGHTHGSSNNLPAFGDGVNGGNAGPFNLVNVPGGTSLAVNIGTSFTGISVQITGGGASENMPPAIVGGLRFIKT